ncbi:hypothetical protein ACIQNG_35560 [Streptomyces sp. NPDC091377]|uniref:hypothetical protein n=1 Tax=Streptomyces sp. NPDC091377 TaxID=3365995 RepID=UPI00382EA902
MLSVAKIQRRNAWRYYIRGVAFGDGRRPVGQSLKGAQELAGLPPGRWLGRSLRALGLTEGAEVSERQLELLFGEGRHPDADRVDVALAAVDVAAVVFTVREKFSRRHILAEARRHLLETLRGREFTRGLDDYIAHRALLQYSRRRTVAKPGRKAPTPDRVSYTADFPLPHQWWIAPAEGTPPRESSRYERARVASLAVQNAIRDARIRAGTATVTQATTSAVSAPADHRDLEGEAASAPHAVDHPGRDAALNPAQRAAAVQAHQQAAMPEEYLEGRTTDPETWLRTPKNLDRLAAFTRAADTRRRAMEDRKAPAVDPASPVDQHRQEHQEQRQQPDPGQGQAPRPRTPCGPHGGTDDEVTAPGAGTRPTAHPRRRPGTGEGARDRSLKHGGPHGCPDPAEPFAGAARAPGAAR